jgi:hypothetical protein
MFIIKPLQILKNGQPTGRWRLTATSDEDGVGPYGDESHDHGSSAEALHCPTCQNYCDWAATVGGRRMNTTTSITTRSAGVLLQPPGSPLPDRWWRNITSVSTGQPSEAGE